MKLMWKPLASDISARNSN